MRSLYRLARTGSEGVAGPNFICAIMMALLAAVTGLDASLGTVAAPATPSSSTKKNAKTILIIPSLFMSWWGAISEALLVFVLGTGTLTAIIIPAAAAFTDCDDSY